MRHELLYSQSSASVVLFCLSLCCSSEFAVYWLHLHVCTQFKQNRYINVKSYISIFSRKCLKKKEFLNTSPLLSLSRHIFISQIFESMTHLSSYQPKLSSIVNELLDSEKLLSLDQKNCGSVTFHLLISDNIYTCQFQSTHCLISLFLGQSILPFCTNLRLEKYNTLNISLFKLSMSPNINPHLGMQMQKSN